VNAKPIYILLLALVLAACDAGSGEGLDENGIPPESSNEEETPNAEAPPTEEPAAEEPPSEEPVDGVTLAELQADIFGPICAQCHVGSGAPQGLRLDSEDNSYDFLVDQPAGEDPSLLRVDPGNPDDSYLVHKIEGRSSIAGSRMPLGQDPLADADIQRIRDWIANGAPRTGTGDASTTVTASAFEPGATKAVFGMHFSRALNPATLNKNTVLVQFLFDDFNLVANTDDYDLHLAGQDLILEVNTGSYASAKAVDIRFNSPLTGTVLDSRGRVLDGDANDIDGGEQHHVLDL
jgi:mono/diheme cytochrome c family protein